MSQKDQGECEMVRGEHPNPLERVCHQPAVQRLSSGFWCVRFSANQFLQWPCERPPRMSDGFGWISETHVKEAERLTAEFCS